MALLTRKTVVPTLDSVLATFDKTVADLEAIHNDEVSKQLAYATEIDNLTERKNQSVKTASKAAAVRLKIMDLISFDDTAPVKTKKAAVSAEPAVANESP